ncbi:MAG TPA: hypothetical protein VN540_01765 [Clostridia bacterium]|nr:hypothetical protein [Clostridia bacterium]
MKAIRYAITIFIALTLLVAGALALADEPAPRQTASTQVCCEVDPYYSFVLPLPATLVYPGTHKLLGDFSVGDLVLPQGAWLTLELIADTMAKTDDPTCTLAYRVQSDIPGRIELADIGVGYAVWVDVDAAAFAAALPGQYRAPLTFRLYLQPGYLPIWEGTTSVTAEKSGAIATSAPPGTQTSGGSGILAVSPTPGATIYPPKTGDGSIFGNLREVGAVLLPIVIIGMVLLAVLGGGVVPKAFLVARDGDAATIVWGYRNRRGRRYEVAPDQSNVRALRGEILGEPVSPPAVFEKGEVDDAFRTKVAPGSIVEWRVKRRRVVVNVDREIE